MLPLDATCLVRASIAIAIRGSSMTFVVSIMLIKTTDQVSLYMCIYACIATIYNEMQTSHNNVHMHLHRILYNCILTQICFNHVHTCNTKLCNGTLRAIASQICNSCSYSKCNNVMCIYIYVGVHEFNNSYKIIMYVN